MGGARVICLSKCFFQRHPPGNQTRIGKVSRGDYRGLTLALTRLLYVIPESKYKLTHRRLQEYSTVPELSQITHLVRMNDYSAFLGLVFFDLIFVCTLLNPP